MSATETPVAKPLSGNHNPFDAPKHSRKRHRPVFGIGGQEISGLNLTAMMDMMTILLVFLVKSYAVEPERININENLRPPVSSSLMEMKPAVTVTVTSELIMVEDKAVVSIADLGSKETESAFVPRLQDALLSRAELAKNIEARGGQKFDGAMLLVAHEDTPYSVLTTVLYTAGQAQFSQFRLLLLKKNTGAKK